MASTSVEANNLNARFFLEARFWKLLTFFLAVSIVLVYLWSVHPIGFPRGYIEDYCSDLARIVISDNLKISGKPGFTTDRFMAPYGMAVPFFSWSLERDWLGAYIWNWNPDFPYSFAHFAASLSLSLFFLGYVLRKTGVQTAWSWILATIFVVFNIPRHFKLWHHFEYSTQHWAYLSVFMDVWIWSRLNRQGRWSLHLEMWRGFFLLAVLTGPGYFWGPMILEWAVVRFCILGFWWVDLKKQIELKPKLWIAPLVLTAIYIFLEWRWFMPLLHEAKKIGYVFQEIGWFSQLYQIFRPLWWDPVFMFDSETITSIGWTYWIPVLISIGVLIFRKSSRTQRLWKLPIPFLTMIAIGILYTCLQERTIFHNILQKLIPPLTFFRVTCRWGIFFPHLTAAIIALSWPDLIVVLGKVWRNFFGKIVIFAFLISSLSEAVYLNEPVTMSVPLPDSTTAILDSVKQSPGTTVLDLPFCIAGGNGVCNAQQCALYPNATAGHCFTAWHGKKVFGLYVSRLSFEQCGIYNRPPYASWFDAWGKNRCFSPQEWDQFCQFLDSRSELSDVLVYPDIWKAAGTAECRAQFESHLGPILQQGEFFVGFRQPEGLKPSRLWKFAPRCIRR